MAKAARERLHPDRMAIVVVGPQKLIEQRIAALGLGRVEFRDAQGEARKAVDAGLRHHASGFHERGSL